VIARNKHHLSRTMGGDTLWMTRNKLKWKKANVQKILGLHFRMIEMSCWGLWVLCAGPVNETNVIVRSEANTPSSPATLRLTRPCK
jgi:hypothetical protein